MKTYDSRFVEQILTPAVFFGILVGTTLVSAIGVAMTMNGHLRGLVSLLLPIALCKFAWDARSSWDGPFFEVKPGLIAWLAGLPLGLVGGAIALAYG